MKYIRIPIFLLLSLIGLIGWSGCDGGDDPQPSTLVFNLTGGTRNGQAVTGTYTLTIKFNAQGQPDGYTSAGTVAYSPTPSVAGSGTWAISGNNVTFTSGSDSRSATASAALTPTSTNLVLTFTLTKLNNDPNSPGTYVYTMAKQ